MEVFPEGPEGAHYPSILRSEPELDSWDGED